MITICANCFLKYGFHTHMKVSITYESMLAVVQVNIAAVLTLIGTPAVWLTEVQKEEILKGITEYLKVLSSDLGGG